jgi:hypothetical protein
LLYGQLCLSKNKVKLLEEHQSDLIVSVIDLTVQALFFCNAETLTKLVCVRLPTQYGVDFQWFKIFPANDALMCFATNAVVHVSIDSPRVQSIISEYKPLKVMLDKNYESFYMCPTEVPLPRHIPLLKKYISVTNSLSKWESTLTSSTVDQPRKARPKP